MTFSGSRFSDLCHCAFSTGPPWAPVSAGFWGRISIPE
ncbi:predicted protein [Plenodomus lingam JN3]|uniref:Predicted protein n=1 Tax=Leptosphaeria maculans (strain JN3 / isolate v23.1.3 / race Av1-4-5-6-7-8) TaxID=985895 RepID=E5A2S7_LEPMJ|nr:predicted protein [Plenodomus lingam JN3]CBX97873.1 predicted protein [Plenodomus lingam JN3]